VGSILRNPEDEDTLHLSLDMQESTAISLTHAQITEGSYYHSEKGLLNARILLPAEALFNLNASDGRIFFPFRLKGVHLKGQHCSVHLLEVNN
jgi:hypothetical protein